MTFWRARFGDSVRVEYRESSYAGERMLNGRSGRYINFLDARPSRCAEHAAHSTYL